MIYKFLIRSNIDSYSAQTKYHARFTFTLNVHIYYLKLFINSKWLRH